MFKIGQKVIHLREGLSIISEVTTMCDREYFVVHTIDNEADNIYVLKDKPEGVIRDIMSKESALKLIDYMKNVKADFSLNTKQRRDQYKKRLASGDPNDLAFLYMQLFLFNQLVSNGEDIKLGATDFDILSFAKKNILDELSLSLNIQRENTESFINAKLI